MENYFLFPYQQNKKRYSRLQDSVGTLHTVSHKRVTFGEGTYFHATDVFLVVKTLKAGKEVGCDESLSKLLKARNKAILANLVCIKWPGVLAADRRIGKLGWSLQYTRGETGGNALTTISFLSWPRMSKALKKKREENGRPKLEDTHCSFPGRSNTDQIFTLRRIF